MGRYKLPPLYNTYRNIIDRCYNENCKIYSYYGGRGVKVCDKHYRVHIIEGKKTVFRQAFETLAKAVEARDKVLKDLCGKRG